MKIHFPTSDFPVNDILNYVIMFDNDYIKPDQYYPLKLNFWTKILSNLFLVMKWDKAQARVVGRLRFLYSPL